MSGRILILLLFAANAHNVLWVLGAVDEGKVTKQLNRMETDQFMGILKIQTLIGRVLQENAKIADTLEKLKKPQKETQVCESLPHIDNETQVMTIDDKLKQLPACERWLQREQLSSTNLFSAEGRFFYFNTTNLDWNQTRDWCAERSMQMAIIKSPSQMDVVARVLDKHSTNDIYWVGASDVGQSPGQFRWADGTLVNAIMWRNGKIHKLHGDSDQPTCAQLYHDYARLTDASCLWGRFILCQVPSDNATCLYDAV